MTRTCGLCGTVGKEQQCIGQEFQISSSLLALGGVLSPSQREHVEPTAPPPGPTEVQSPMKLTVPLGGDEKHRSVVDLDINHSADSPTRRNSWFDRMKLPRLESVSAWTVRAGRTADHGLLGHRMVRQKLDVSLVIVGSGTSLSWKDRIVLA